MSNITQVSFGAARTRQTLPLHQYDYGQVLQFVGLDLPTAYEVHFANGETGDAVTSIGNVGGVSIPNELLTSGEDIHAWLFLHAGSEDGETVYHAIIPVIRRSRPPEDEPTPEQESAISQAIIALNAGVARAEDAADEAEGSATLSRSWAAGGTGSRDGEDQNNAKFWAELSQQGAETSGYAFFDVDDETGEMIVTVADSLDKDLRFVVDENTGILEVHVL